MENKRTTSNVEDDRYRKKHKTYNRSVYQSLALVSQFGINMLVPIFLLTFAGIWLDDRLHTSYWVIILFFVGAMAGFRNIIKMAEKIYSKSERKGGSRIRNEKDEDENWNADRNKKDQ